MGGEGEARETKLAPPINLTTLKRPSEAVDKERETLILSIICKKEREAQMYQLSIKTMYSTQNLHISRLNPLVQDPVEIKEKSPWSPEPLSG